MIDVPIDINAHIDTKILRGHLQEFVGLYYNVPPLSLIDTPAGV
jgi:hypothetical protein